MKINVKAFLLIANPLQQIRNVSRKDDHPLQICFAKKNNRTTYQRCILMCACFGLSVSLFIWKLQLEDHSEARATKFGWFLLVAECAEVASTCNVRMLVGNYKHPKVSNISLKRIVSCVHWIYALHRRGYKSNVSWKICAFDRKT